MKNSGMSGKRGRVGEYTNLELFSGITASQIRLRLYRLLPSPLAPPAACWHPRLRAGGRWRPSRGRGIVLTVRWLFWRSLFPPRTRLYQRLVSSRDRYFRNKDRHFHLRRNADALVDMAIGRLANLVGHFEPPAIGQMLCQGIRESPGRRAADSSHMGIGHHADDKSLGGADGSFARQYKCRPRKLKIPFRTDIKLLCFSESLAINGLCRESQTLSDRQSGWRSSWQAHRIRRY